MEKESLISLVMSRETRFVIVTGGVCSSIGKGVLTSSLGVLIKSSGASVSVVKWDPYLNVDPGTLSPLVHGEVFVTDDGAETDLDLGHYERMIGIHLSRESSVSSGQIFKEILDAEREGKFLGSDIQLVPHVVDAINHRLLRFALQINADFVLVEIGGTVGDMEGEVFLEAIRQLRMKLASHQMMHCHLSYVPYLAWAYEIKTKPTQHSVMLLKKAGLIPDALFLRSERGVGQKSIEKVAVMCGVQSDLIFQVLTRDPIFKLFLDLKKQDLHIKLQRWFGVEKPKDSDLSAWKDLVERIKQKKPRVTIGLVVKYVGSNDPYISVIQAIKSAAYAAGKEPEIIAIAAEHLEKNRVEKNAYDHAIETLQSVDGIVIPGGFDNRGIEGKIAAATFAREQKIPYLGLCLGLQVMLIECARNIAGLAQASSTEFDPKTPYPAIALLDEQQRVVQKGGTMRLGLFSCSLIPGTKAHKAYGKDEVFERHRHRYEFNNVYRSPLEDAGVVFSGINKERNLVEIAELKDHPFMLGTQFHPEFLSTPLVPHPLFKAFIAAIIGQD